MHIAVYTMAKNEARNVQRFAETTRGADVVVVTDTGSTDGTPDLLRDVGIQVHTARVVPWRFDLATNIALCHVPDYADVCVKLDLDEVIHRPQGSWREAIEQAWKPGITHLRYWYTWSWQVPGQVPGVKFMTGHIHARSNYIWRFPGHAGLYCTGKEQAAPVDLEIHHYMDSKSRPNYLPLLQLGVSENKCPRTLYYLGREYYFRAINDNAVYTLDEYLSHPQSRWKQERASAMRMLGITHRRMGKPDLCLNYLLRADLECPKIRDIWYEILHHFHWQRDWDGGVWAGKQCLACNQRDPEYMSENGEPWSEQPYLLTAACARSAGRRDTAREILQQAVRQFPESKRVADAMAEHHNPRTEIPL